MEQIKRTDEVFGVSTNILSDSYIDRGHLDKKISKILSRQLHLALRGASKSGKSWLRQNLITNPLVIQCRLGKTVDDIYREALGQLGLKLEVTSSVSTGYTGSAEAESEAGHSLLGKVRAKISGSISGETGTNYEPLRFNISDLDFVATAIRESNRRLVIEDFHYLSTEERRRFAFDLKTLWDLQVYVVVIGVWSDNNLLLNLNSELIDRVREVAITWSNDDLARVLIKGSRALNLDISNDASSKLLRISYNNVGILQRLTLDALDHIGIEEGLETKRTVLSPTDIEDVAMEYAEELNSVYQTFADRVSTGIRQRANSTQQYAYTLAAVMEATDRELLTGVPFSKIHEYANRREPRIQQGNLKNSLKNNLERLQVDDEGRGLVLSYADDRIRVVDHRLLVYRNYSTIQWPWEDLIRESDLSSASFESDSPIP